MANDRLDAGPRPCADVTSLLVTLVRPPMISSVNTWRQSVTPPLGLAYVASFLHEAGIPVAVVESVGEAPHQRTLGGGYARYGLALDEILERIDPRSTHIGVSCMFTQDWPQIREILTAIRGRFPDAVLVGGGEHITALPEWSLRDCRALDVAVLGEGEETLVELCRFAGDRASWNRIDGIAYLDGDRFVSTAPRRRIREVESIPRPAWDLFPVEAYASTTSGHGVYRGRTMGILATRGCPYQCTFCSNPLMYGTLWVARDVDDVLDEIQEYIDRYQIENIDFFDLTMILKRSWILDFCRRIEERGMQFTWQLPSGTRSEVVDDEISRALYRTGCRYVAYAPESGSRDTLVKIKKKVRLERLNDSLRSALRNKMAVRVNLILGFPHETRKHVLTTILYAWRLAVMGVHETGIYIFSPYPGTELFDELRAEGRITDLDDAYFRALTSYLDASVPTGFCRHVSGRELWFWRLFGMMSFFAVSFLVRPWRFAAFLRGALGKGHKATALETRVAVMLQRRRKHRSEGAGTAPILPNG